MFPRQLYGRIMKKRRSVFDDHVRLLAVDTHFGLDTPKSMTLGYIAYLSANK
jgi:hypothetical protein